MNKKQNSILRALGSALVLSLVSCGGDSDTTTVTAPENEAATESVTDSNYPLTTCVVSGEELGSMGVPVEVTHEGTTVKLCCKSCIKKFDADPAKFAAMVKAGE